MRGLRYRLYRQNGIIVVSIVLIFQVIFLSIVYNYYYEGAKSYLRERAELLSNFYNEQLMNENIGKKAKFILENEYRNENFYIQVIDSNGLILIDSYGQRMDYETMSKDVVNALNGKGSIYEGSDSKEKIMAMSMPLYKQGKIDGVIRYVIKINDVSSMIWLISGITIAVGILVVVIMLVFSNILARGIVEPIKELTNIAEVMATGNFDLRSDIRKEDEIGKLSQTLNFMADEIQRSEEIKNEFLSSISHELRTPLTAIRGWSEIILSGDTESREEDIEGIQIISKEAERLSGLVEELLDFSKFEAGRIELQRSKVSINEIADEIFKHFKANFLKKNIKGELILSELDIIINADKKRLIQVLVNIVDNAIKFTSEEGNICISTFVDGESYGFRVMDDGIGIPKKDLERVTKKFYKGEYKESGSGIGLAISEDIIKLHGGRIVIQSEVKRGTIVNIYLGES